MNNLNNTTLNVAIELGPPYCVFANKNNANIHLTDLKYSIEFELLKLMMSRYGFQVSLKNDFYDSGKKVNQTWVGTMGKVLNGTIHLAMCGNVLSKNDHFDVIQFTQPFIFDELTFMSLVPERHPRTWIILEPFYPKLWLSILIAWLICIKFLGNSNIFRLFAVLIRQSIELKKLRSQHETIFIGWLLASLVLSNSYTSVFHSILTFPDYEQTIETKEDLVKYLQLDDSFTRVLIYRNFFADIYESKIDKDDIYFLIKSFDRRTKYSFLETIPQMLKAFREKTSKQVIFIDFRLYMMWFRRNAWDLDRWLYLSKDRLKTLPIGWILPPGSPLLTPFNQVIIRVFEVGIVQHWTDKTFKTFPAKDQSLAYDRTSFEKEPSFRAFKLEDFQSIFMVWSFGVIVSIFYFGLEILYFCLKYF